MVELLEISRKDKRFASRHINGQPSKNHCWRADSRLPRKKAHGRFNFVTLDYLGLPWITLDFPSKHACSNLFSRNHAVKLGSAGVSPAVFGLWPKTLAPGVQIHPMVTPIGAVRLAGGTPARATETVALPFSIAWIRFRASGGGLPAGWLREIHARSQRLFRQKAPSEISRD